MITVRHFAAAAEAAGTSTERLDVDTVGALREVLLTSHGPAMGRVLAQSALLAGGVRVDDDDVRLDDGIVVDVLPPFAGG
ncbi:MoaD/ThiS family protein [Actinotalea sp.]|uniref:MoaD/ThiS family protein n=1 Tax=Actinotalea sp. TaxID=1872145 RepID=UPI00356627A1